MLRSLVPPNADHLVLVFTDVEMGAGGPLDDFPHSAWLGELLLEYNEAPYRHLRIDLVFGGDTFDLLKTSVDGEYPRHVTAAVASAKLARVAAAHPGFFSAIRAFLAHPHAERRVFFVVGNHDPELLFPEVQGELRRLLGGHPEVHFPGFELNIGDVHIEHGQQWDPMFRMEPTRRSGGPDVPAEEVGFVLHRGERILDLPWGAVALLDVAIPLQPILYHHDRLKPRSEVFALLPDVHEAVVNAYWQYWARDWARAVWRGDDPLKRVTWTMLREVAYRFRSGDGDVAVRSHFERALARPSPHRVYVVGHEHRPAWTTWGDRKLLMTGAFRDEYAVEDRGRTQRAMPKTWAEVFLRDGRALVSQLQEIYGPPPPEGHVPASIFEVLEPVRALLASRSAQERQALTAAQAAQADDEAKEPRD